jgi:hypothetical protein
MTTTTRRPLGYQVTQTFCRACAPEGVRDFCNPMREGDDHGIPYSCDVCGEDLKPCEHKWNEWRPAFGGGEIRFCTVNDCGESDRR